MSVLCYILFPKWNLPHKNLNSRSWEWWCRPLVPALWRTETGASQQIQSQLNVHSEFRVSQGYTAKPTNQTSSNLTLTSFPTSPTLLPSFWGWTKHPVIKVFLCGVFLKEERVYEHIQACSTPSDDWGLSFHTEGLLMVLFSCLLLN